MGFDDPGYPDYQTYVDADTKAADAYLGAFSPAHVLRTVAAHRAILARHGPGVSHPDECGRCNDPWPCDDVLHLAAIYTDREGWDPSWTTGDSS